MIKSIQELVGQLENVKGGGDSYSSKCPHHDDGKNSLSIFKGYDGNWIIKCHAGCEFTDIADILGLKKSVFKPSGITNIYQYFDENGDEIFQSVRFFPKDFKQRRKNKNGEFVWDLKGVETTLYRLPELIASAKNRAVFIVEGEKDVDNLIAMGLVATSCPLGAGKWKSSYNKFLKDRTCYIVQDVDEAGRKSEQLIAKELYGIAKEIRIIKLPSDKSGYDISDYLESHTKEDLKNLILASEIFTLKKEDIKIETKTDILAAPKLELEIINYLLSNNDEVYLVFDKIEHTDFYLPIHKNIFKVIKTYFEDAKYIDSNILLEELKNIENEKVLEEVKKTLSNKTFLSFYEIDSYIEKILSYSKLRQLNKICSLVIDKSRGIDNHNNEDVFEFAENQIATLLSLNNSDNRIYTGTSLISNSLNRYEAIKNSTSNVTGIETGFTDIDCKLLGYQKQDMIVIAARPSMGKTTFLLNTLKHSVINQKRTVLFSLEMSKERIIDKLICIVLGINTQKYLSGNINDDELNSILSLRNSKVFDYLIIDDTAGITPAYINKFLKKSEYEYGKIEIIGIDYIQLMSSGKKRENRQQEITTISAELKAIFKTYNIPGIVLSQLSRSPENRQNKRPLMSDLRESGSIEQDADIVSFLYREDYYSPDSIEGYTEFIISKNRMGPTGTINLMFDREQGIFHQTTDQTDF